jgi:chemosensory pili system protein ChpA (sensor histidine kinase/response regulator)
MRRHLPLVLFIEDDRDYREVLQRLLEGIGVRVVVAADGIEGLEQLEQSRPDLVFCDLAMPRMAGIEFGIRMQRDMRFGHVPLIAVTGRRDQAALLDSWSAGFDGYLDKPVTTNVLVGVIERFAGRLSGSHLGRTA